MKSRVRCGKTDRDGRNVRDGVGRGGRLHERSEGPPVEVEVEGAPQKYGPRRKNGKMKGTEKPRKGMERNQTEAYRGQERVKMGTMRQSATIAKERKKKGS